MGEATGSLMAAAPVTIAAMSTARKFFIVVVMERYDEDRKEMMKKIWLWKSMRALAKSKSYDQL